MQVATCEREMALCCTVLIWNCETCCCDRVSEKGLTAALFHPTLFYLDVSGTAVSLGYVAAVRGSALTGCLTVIAERCPPTARQDGITWT